MNFVITPIVQRLILINIVVFGIVSIITAVDFSKWLSLHGMYSGAFIPTQFLTCTFMHADIGHLFGNMFGVFIFGPLLERFLGGKKFLTLYLVCGVGSSILFWGANAIETHFVRNAAIEYLQNPGPDQFAEFIRSNYPRGYEKPLDLLDGLSNDPTNPKLIELTKEHVAFSVQKKSNSVFLGASGALFGIMMAMALLFPNTEVRLYFLIPVKIKYLVTVYGLWEAYSMYKNDPGDNVGHFAHLAGMLFAFILIRYWKTNRNSFY